MRATRRRHRTIDPLASSEAVHHVCEQLREYLPEFIPKSEKELVRLLYAIRHVERHTATDTRRGRPSRWPRENLLKAAGVLRNILERETSGRVSLSSFIGQFIPILSFPSDITEALSCGDINLQEAVQLARLISERLECTPSQAQTTRKDVLQAHLRMHGSQNVLRARVKEILGETIRVSTEQMSQVVAKVDELLEIDAADGRHFFYEEMKRLFYAMREIEPEDLDDESIERFMKVADEMSNVIFSIQMKRKKRDATPIRFAL